MNILITGITGFKNRGVEALVLPIISQLQEKYPQCHITISTWTPEYDRERVAQYNNVDFVQDYYLFTKSWHAPHSGRGIRKYITKIGKKIAKNFKIENSLFNTDAKKLLPYTIPDLMIMSGGDLISSDYGSELLGHFLKPIHWAHAHSVPSALIGHSIGKFKSKQDVSLWQHAEKKATLITVRDPLSKIYLVNELGSDETKIRQTADTAFLLKPDDVLIRSYNLKKKNPVVAVSISETICSWTSSDYNAHIDVWCRLIRRILTEWNAHVIIIPHVQIPECDDRVASTKVMRKLEFDSRVEIAGADLTASEYKGILCSCDMVIAERMHVAIGALSSGIPTVPIGYSIKAEGIINQICNNSGIDASNYVLPIKQFLETDYSLEFLDKAWNNRDEFKEVLKSRLPSMILLSKNNFELLDDVISKI